MNTLLTFYADFYTAIFVTITGITALFVLSKRVSPVYRNFCLVIIFLSGLELAANAMVHFWHKKNHFLFNILHAIQFVLIPYIYSYWLQNKVWKRVINVYLVVFLLAEIINFFWGQRFDNLFTYTFILGGAFLLVLSIAYLYQLYSDESELRILRDPVFWISLGYLIFMAVFVPYYGMLNYLVSNHREFATLYYYVVIDGTICVFNILLTIGLLCSRTMR